MLQGAANRKVAATNMNLASSRSHGVFTCIIESKWESQGVTRHLFARLNLVDLAGSERKKSSSAKGERLKEATKSLSTLVYNCPKLEDLSREEGSELFPRLREIIIADCPKLSFPNLSAPKKLSLVGECTMGLNSISNLNSLTSLTICCDDETVCFPKEFLRNLTLLESLVIEYCCELKVLPADIASLVTLKSLKIKDCPKLESLPEEGLRGLEFLQSLHIIDCRELERRCEKGKGEDWCCHALWVTMAATSIEVAVASDALLVGRFWVVHGLHKLYKLIVTVYGTPRGTHLHRYEVFIRGATASVPMPSW
ncbi:hypothetical protein TEA_026782 [Camellia sinensis var. sinensis]|uniref:Kinesin-like protein n=1 Tax=Camellia sinensis var. sinensis TaxID=542762 RepID=A0A4S4D9I6_CAMSN|nr:hypothetical protein TEA_026782 [Camellia sinensis var. sinensis]